MRSKLLAASGDLRTFAVILETGDEIMASLQAFADAQKLTAAHFSAIGALSHGVISYFDWEKKEYLKIPVEEQVEVAAFNGDVAISPEGKPAIHAHVVLGRRSGAALAGHLTEGHVRPTLEIILTETPAHLHKQVDPASGVALIRL